YAHSGTSTAFNGEIRWGATTIFSRSAAAADSGLSGRGIVGLYSGGQNWDVESWGSTTSIAATLGNATENIAQNVVISLRGQMAVAASDSVTLRNFTVIRYPAQANP